MSNNTNKHDGHLEYSLNAKVNLLLQFFLGSFSRIATSMMSKHLRLSKVDMSSHQDGEITKLY